MYNISTSPTKQYPNQQTYVGVHKKEVDKIIHSWNDLQDKPFGGEWEIILPKTLVPYSPPSQEPPLIPLNQPLIPGQTYEVSVDGTVYKLEAKLHPEDDNPTVVYVGDNLIVSDDYDYGFMIAMIQIPENTRFIKIIQTLDAELPEPTVLEIVRPVNIKTIDPKYLPNTTHGGMVIIISEDAESGNLVSNVSYTDVLNAILNGQHVVCLYPAGISQIFYPSYITNMSDVISGVASVLMEQKHIKFTSVDYGATYIELYDDNTVKYESGN